MEKIINEIYSNNNFPIILFSLIGIFIVLFIITLILALRDARRNTKEIIEEEKMDADSSKHSEDTIVKVDNSIEIEDNSVKEDTTITPIKIENTVNEATTSDVDNLSKENSAEMPIVFEDINFDENKDAEKEVVPSNDIVFTNVENISNKDKEDILNESTTVMPVLNDDEISNFEEFFLDNLKDAHNKDDIEKVESNNIDKTSNEAKDVFDDAIFDFTDGSMELPKRKDI